MLVIIGPSTSGKSSVARELHRRRVLRVHPTWTTRPRRDEERAGCLEHRFVTDAAFDRLCAQGFFLQTVAWVGGAHRYGLPPLPGPSDGLVDAVILRAPFVEGFARRHGGDQLVYQIEDSVERARDRLALRGCPAAELTAAGRPSARAARRASGRPPGVRQRPVPGGARRGGGCRPARRPGRPERQPPAARPGAGGGDGVPAVLGGPERPCR